MVSATSSVIYAQSVWPEIPLIPGTIAIITLFAVLFFWGITDSANVAMVRTSGRVRLAVLAVCWQKSLLV